MVDADHVRLGRIVEKLAEARAKPVVPMPFGVEVHGFVVGPPLSEAVVAEFEERHEVSLPPAYRLFVTELGGEGAGPGYGLCRLELSCCAYLRSGHLAQPSPYLPGLRYPVNHAVDRDRTGEGAAVQPRRGKPRRSSTVRR